MLIPVQMVLLLLRARPATSRLPRFYHRMCCRILGIDVRHQGELCRDHPVLFVANHASYLDITVLGSLIAGSFVSKAEVADWPFFGLLAKLQRTVFIDRRSSKAAHHRDEIGARLESGDDLILFPEGTSSDGNRVLPFKSALFSVAERRVRGRPITVQPVSVAYSHIDGIPLGREWRPQVAWYGGMDIGPHIWNLIALGKLTVQVIFHEPLDRAEIEAALAGNGGVTASALRKLMADRSHAVVAQGHAEALFASGRRPIAAAASGAVAVDGASDQPVAAQNASGDGSSGIASSDSGSDSGAMASAGVR
jgi:1-acyl-sn-glycerol-3-phosphate acyltransferase